MRRKALKDENKEDLNPSLGRPSLSSNKDATSNKGHRYERSRDATNVAPGTTTSTRNKDATRSKKLLGAPGIATRNKDATRSTWPYY